MASGMSRRSLPHISYVCKVQYFVYLLLLCTHSSTFFFLLTMQALYTPFIIHRLFNVTDQVRSLLNEQFSGTAHNDIQQVVLFL